MRVLVLSDIEWSVRNAFGNTISNWFEGMEEWEFASIYTRSSKPDNAVCRQYYAIKPSETVRGIINKEAVGNIFTSEDCAVGPFLKPVSLRSGAIEKKLIGVIHRKNIKFAYKADEFFFRLKNWDNRKFAAYINAFRADIVFFFVTNSIKTKMLLDRIKELVPESKTVGFIADDVYGNSSDDKSRRIIQDMIKHADLLYGASEILCSEYKKKFNVHISPLYKGCRFTGSTVQKSHNTIQLVYAGNLYYGRLDTLVKLSDAIEEYNSQTDRKIYLSIFSGTEISGKAREKLDRPGCVKFCGEKPYKEIVDILAHADIVLHIESFEENQKKIVRYSFSTKIIDCLQSGTILMVIGPSGIASVEYARGIPGTIVIDSEAKINALGGILESVDLKEAAQNIYQYAVNHHDIQNVQAMLRNDFKDITGRN